MRFAKSSFAVLTVLAVACGGGSNTTHGEAGVSANEVGTFPSGKGPSADGGSSLFPGLSGVDGAAAKADTAPTSGGLTGLFGGADARADVAKSSGGLSGLFGGASGKDAATGGPSGTGGVVSSTTVPSGLGGAGGAPTTGPASTGGTGAVSTGQQEVVDGTVGSSCGACAAGLACLSDGVPNGYCTRTCTVQSDCGAAGACILVSTAAICYRMCQTDDDCRPGYACYYAGTVSVCDVM